MLVLSVDPGTICTGLTLADDSNDEIIVCDKIHVPSKWNQSKRLAYMLCGIQTMIDEYSPELMAIESQFVGRNSKTSLITARAKGIAIAVASMSDMQVVEYAPTEIKSAVTGHGNADKLLVADTIIKLYSNSEIVKNLGEFKDTGKDKNDDKYDSLGIYHTYKTLGLTKADGSSRLI